MTIEVKGTLLRTDAEPDGTYTMYVIEPVRGIRAIQMLPREFITTIYARIGPSQEVEFSFNHNEAPAEAEQT